MENMMGCINSEVRRPAADAWPVVPRSLRPVVKSVRCLSEFYESSPVELNALDWQPADDVVLDMVCTDAVICRSAFSDGWTRLYVVGSGTDGRHPVKVLRFGVDNGEFVAETATLI